MLNRIDLIVEIGPDDIEELKIKLNKKGFRYYEASDGRMAIITEFEHVYQLVEILKKQRKD
jgi:hypothetical protein